MAIGDRKFKWAGHTAWGYPYNLLHNVIEHTFGYTHHMKKVAAGTATAVLSSTASLTTSQTITAGLTNPDVPRLLTIVVGGTAGQVLAANILINGTNVEGKPITDTFATTAGATGTINGTLVFKTVTSIVFPGMSGTGVTITAGTQNKLGLNHRLPANRSTIVVIQSTATIPTSTTAFPVKPTQQAAPTSSNVDGQLVEKNYVQPATTPDGTTTLYFFYWDHKVLVYPAKDSPDFYSTTTSTSTSSTSSSTSSTSSSTSTSVSSTSTSISSTSTSSTSTSSTSSSTSTTTLP